MNERIRTLMEEVVRIEVDPDSGMETIYTCGPEDFEAYAELIVRECIGVVNKTDPPGYEDYPDYRDQIEQSFRRECAIGIKKHFGVDE